MQAAVRTRYGPPDVVRITNVDRPVPKDHELLVRIHAATVNRKDCGLRAAKPFIVRFFMGLSKPRLTVLGSEFAGEVVAVGSGVTSFRAGDRVFGYDDSRCGAHAEYKAIAEDGPVATLPANLTFEEAAAATEGSHYALVFIRKAKIESGQDVLVSGATGAIGSAAVQLIKGLGAHVTAVCATEHLALVEGLGADRVIDYRVEDFTKDEQRYDVVLDAVGKSSFGRCRHLLKPGGLYPSSDLGPLSQNPLLALVTPLFGGRSPVPHPDDRPGDGPIPPRSDRDRRVSTGHRPPVSLRPDRRGVPVCRNGSEGRQRRDHDASRRTPMSRLDIDRGRTHTSANEFDVGVEDVRDTHLITVPIDLRGGRG